MRTWTLARISKVLSPLEQHFVVKRYAVARAMAILAVLLRWLLEPVLGTPVSTSRSTWPLSSPRWCAVWGRRS